ncbi:MAG: hypothetical protein HKN07_08135 [Acidimicrobiia bacterium]|nr:hypothetical protein [Acidimicrobiia bacterium]
MVPLRDALVVALSQLLVIVAVHGQCEVAQLSVSEPVDYGRSIAISGETAVVGDSRFPEAGRVHLFRFFVDEWQATQILTAPVPEPADRFGDSIALADDLLIVGSPGAAMPELNRGAAYIFRRIGDEWTFESYLVARDGGAGHFFGTSVATDGFRVLIGAWKAEDMRGRRTGAAYSFIRDSGSWMLEAKLLDPVGAEDDLFGVAVSLSGHTAVIGAHGFDGTASNSGKALVFTRTRSRRWELESELRASDPDTSDQFGRAVSINGNVAAVGALQEDDPGANSGAAYVFRRSRSGWSEEQKLEAADASPVAFLGRSISLSDDGNTVLIGASGDSEGAFEAGAVYVFRHNSERWHEDTKIIAMQASAGAHFGTSVSTSGNLALVGSPGSIGEASVISGVLNVDCNRNDEPDSCDIFDGVSMDRDGDGVPDECRISADLDGDGVVGFSDLLLLLTRWGICGVPCPPTCTADFNRDCEVGFWDLLFLLGEWSRVHSP